VVNPAPAWHQQRVLSQDQWAPIVDWAAVCIAAIAALTAGLALRRALRRRGRRRVHVPAAATLWTRAPVPDTIGALTEENDGLPAVRL
ncbi:MAG TPA: hypothetical protein VMU14_23390, partial [Acidimicrobiales bacterium]|nr:hypothetical protein [Acidimicrobiales bacterium]